MNTWRCIILAAGRGPDDPMAKAFGVEHKCALPIAGQSMFQWVMNALRQSNILKPFTIVIDNFNVIPKMPDVEMLDAAHSAPASAFAALRHTGHYPTLLTTGDHPLLTPAMVNHMLRACEATTADVCVGLATAETINAAHPETKRTYFNLGGTRVSGCNLFAIKTVHGLRLLERWQDLERNRKKPWKLVSAFGIKPIIWFAFGLLTPERAFGHISKQLGITVVPIFLPFAEAAIDVDKPSDHALAERILKSRSAPV